MENSSFGGAGRTPATSRTGRVPRWVLDEAAGRPPADPGLRTWQTPARAARGRGVHVWVLSAMVVAIVGVSTTTGSTGFGPLTTSAVREPLSRLALGGDPHRPTPGGQAQSSPLGEPAPGTHSSAFRFLATQEGGDEPVAYDPCRPVHVAVGGSAPAGGDAALTAAVAEVSEATGLRFVRDAPTDEPASDDREAYQPERYGDRWAPVLIVWETDDLHPDLAAGGVGLGGSRSLSLPGGPSVYVTGQIELDARQLAEVLARPDGADQVRVIVQHELSHVVGLGHVDDPGQVMFPEARPGVHDFGAGDLTGLAALGRGVCVPEL